MEDPYQTCRWFHSFFSFKQTPDIAFWGMIGVLGLLIIFSALLSAAEVAFFSLQPSEKEKIEQENNPASRRILSLLSQPQKLLAAILIGNNLVNISIVLLATFIIHHYLHFEKREIQRFIFELITITGTILLFGEVFPKAYATYHTSKIARFMSRPLLWLISLFSPFIQLLLLTSTTLSARIKKRGLSITKTDLEHAIKLADDLSKNAGEQKILKGIVRFGDVSVKQVMKPRIDVAAIDASSDYHTVLQCINECGYSRIPVYEDSFDNIIGILHIKDLLPHLNEPKDFDWKKLLRTPFFVPEHKKLDDLLRDFQKRKMHLAIVVDEYGAVPGIITLEDVLEEIVGEITDEYDDDEIFYSKIDDHNILFEGKILLKDFYRIMDVKEIEEFEQHKGDSETLGGFIMELTGRIPQKNEKISFGSYIFTIESSDRKKIRSIKVTRTKKSEKPPEQ